LQAIGEALQLPFGGRHDTIKAAQASSLGRKTVIRQIHQHLAAIDQPQPQPAVGAVQMRAVGPVGDIDAIFPLQAARRHRLAGVGGVGAVGIDPVAGCGTTFGARGCRMRQRRAHDRQHGEYFQCRGNREIPCSN
jgi:hypothetical protein